VSGSGPVRGFGAELVEIDADDFGDGMVGPAFLDQRNEQRAGFLKGAQALGAAGGGVGVALHGGVGGDDQHVAGAEAARAASAPGSITPRTGTGTAS
jgi:hypothetical protein